MNQAKQKIPDALKSMDIAAQKREELKQLFPEAFDEGKIDFEQLKRALGELVEPGKERFGLSWPGKAECMKIIQQPSVATLKPARDESVNFDETENLFIEGDNLEVLKLLQKSYFGKVKMIYIDPPYNTGKEFIYPDKYAETLETYLSYTGQIDDDGRKFSTNTDAVGRYHSNWLNMMYPRLYLARNLLREDGVIFISIDDNEQANLKLLCDQIFGEENFINNIIWQKKYAAANDAKWLSDTHDFILCYAKSKDVWRPNHFERSEELNSKYSNPDDDPRGAWYPTNLSVKTYSEKNDYVITSPAGIDFSPPPSRCWVVSKEKYEELLADNRIWFGKDGTSRPYQKKFLTEVQQGVVPTTLWLHPEAGHTVGAKSEVRDLFEGSSDLFDTPKPTKLLQRILDMSTDEDCIVMDFFAGSASLAHAVFNENLEDNGKRVCITVQLPEKIDNSDQTIADLAKERIRRAAKKISEKQNGQLDLNGSGALDLGFKVFKLSPSNFKIWEGDIEKIENLEQQLFDHIDHLSAASTPEDILYELLLKAGFSLTTQVEKIQLAGTDVFSIEEGAMLICLDKDLSQEVIDAMAEANPPQVICLDEGFKGNDQLKANAVQTFKSCAQTEESEIVFKTV